MSKPSNQRSRIESYWSRGKRADLLKFLREQKSLNAGSVALVADIVEALLARSDRGPKKTGSKALPNRQVVNSNLPAQASLSCAYKLALDLMKMGAKRDDAYSVSASSFGEGSVYKSGESLRKMCARKLEALKRIGGAELEDFQRGVATDFDFQLRHHRARVLKKYRAAQMSVAGQLQRTAVPRNR